jgi:hypothetical protein
VPGLGPSLIRTLVPVLVTLLGPWAARWLGIEATQLEQALSVALGAAYYLLVRLLEQRLPRMGWLLGYPQQPTYEPRHAA